MKRYIHLLSILLVLFACACDAESEADVELEAIEEIAQEVTAVDTPTAVEEATAVTPGDTSASSATELGGLTSYRSQATITDQETQQVSQQTAVGIIEPFALHTITEGADDRTEVIAINNSMWLYMPGIGWYETAFSAEEMAMSPAELLAEIEEVELPEIPPLPADIHFLAGQVPLPLMEGGLTPVGAEVINGIACRKMAVDTAYSYEMEVSMVGTMETAVSATGFIWVADQNDLPPIIMQADILETETTNIGGQETAVTRQIEQQITAINEPVNITPPADAVTLDSLQDSFDDDTETTEATDQEMTTADLSGLSSYRLEQTATSISDGDEISMTYLFEWVQDPPTSRFVTDMGEFVIEHLWLEDGVWLRMSGGDWMPITADEAPDPFAELGVFDELDEEMTLVGEETVNGVRCRHYLAEFTMAEINGRHDVWVADESDLPPLVIRTIMRTEQQGLTSIIETNLYDINQPITFELPN